MSRRRTGLIMACAAVAIVAAKPTEDTGVTGGGAAPGSEPTGKAAGHAPAAPGGTVADIPPRYLALYRKYASTCGPLHWSLLAGVGKVETNHGRTDLPGVHSGANYAGAAGPMQFLPATFDGVRKAHPDVGPNQYNPATAVHAAAHYLCDSGIADGDVYGAVFTYNRADWYVAKVRAQAADYRAAA